VQKIEVVYKDKNFLVVNKPAGLLVHSVNLKPKTKNLKLERTLVDWLLENYPEVKNVGDDPEARPGIVHRLDKDTSGIMLIARNQETFDYLKSLFQKHQIQKTYIALVAGKVKDKTGRIDKPIGIKSGTAKRSVFAKKMKMVKEAITEYKIIKYVALRQASAFSKLSADRQGKDFTLLEVMPQTGRTHQIRVHLAYIGHPVAGDKMYGGKRTKVEGLARQFLHAQSVEFTSPDGKRMRFEAELPPDLLFFINEIR